MRRSTYYVDNKSARNCRLSYGSPETDGLDPDTESANL
jgi:hypothetical protein